MTVIRDQRHMVGPYELTTVEEVWAAWEAICADPNFPGFPNRNNERNLLQALVEWERPTARVDWSRWVADCTNPDCRGAMACWRSHANAACLDCGYYFSVIFPTPQLSLIAIRILELRPEVNRCWDPRQQDAKDLIRENIQNGFPIPGAVREAIVANDIPRRTR